MTVTLQPKERDAVFTQLSAEFTGFGDLESALSQANYEACYQLGRKFSDSLRLIIDGGLGWQQRTADPTVLTLPDKELRQIFERLGTRISKLDAAKQPEAEAMQGEMDEIASIVAAAESVFEQTSKRIEGQDL